MFVKLGIALIVCMITYAQAIKPLIAMHYYTKNDIPKALHWSPEDSTYLFKAGNILRAIENNNGDLTQYSLWTNLAVKIAEKGDREKADLAIEKALWYYPDFEPAKKVAEAIKTWK